MATPIGKITFIEGAVTAIDNSGNERVLELGSVVYSNETITTGEAGRVLILFNDGSTEFAIGRQATVVLDSEVYDAAGGGLEQDVASVEAIQAALLEDPNFDPTAGLEATAAGPGAGGPGVEGAAPPVLIAHDFLNVVPTSGYPTGTFETLFPEPEEPIDPLIAEEAPEPPNNPPDAVNDLAATNDALVTNEDEPLQFNQSVILANDYDPDGDNFNIIGVSNPVNGTVTYVNGTITFTPDPDYNGPAQFDYTIEDTEGAQDTATVFIDVLPVNDPPVPADDEGQAKEGALPEDAAIAASGNLLTNDSDIDSSSLSVSAVSADGNSNSDSSGPSLTVQGLYGTLTITASSGAYEYVVDDTNATVNAMNEDDTLQESFTYTSFDGEDGTDAKLYITILGTNDAPVAYGDVNSISEDAGLGEIPASVSGNVLSNDTDVDNDDGGSPELFVTDIEFGENSAAVSGEEGTQIAGDYGLLTIYADGSYSYDVDQSLPAVQALDEGQSLTETFSYTMSDSGGDALLDGDDNEKTDTANLVITINGADDTAEVTVAAEGSDSTVYETGLPAGIGELADGDATNNSDPSETDTTGSFDVSASDGLSTVTVGGEEFTVAELKGFNSDPSDPIDTGEGWLTITGYSSSDGDFSATIDYTYTLKTAQEHPDPGNDSVYDSVAVTVLGVGGSTDTANLSIDIVDDTPVAFTPDAVHAVNQEDVLVEELNFNAAAGADGVGSVIFTGISEGSEAMDADEHNLTYNGEQLYLYTFDEGTKLVASTESNINQVDPEDAETTGFIITLDASGDIHTFVNDGIIDNGTVTEATDLTGVGGGNVSWKALYGEVDSPDPQGDYALANTSEDVMLSTVTGESVNTNAHDIGISSQNSLTVGEVVQFDFVDDLEAYKSGPNWLFNWGGEHNQVYAYRQTVNFVNGPGANLTVLAIAVADHDLSMYDDTSLYANYDNLVNLHGDIRVFDADGNEMTDSLNLIDNADGSVTIEGMQADWYFTVDSTESFEAIQISGAEGTGEFKLGTFSYGEDSFGTPVDLTYDIQGIDGDGDTVDSSLSVHLYPDGNTIVGDAGDNTLEGGDTDENLLGYAGDDTLDGGGGDDILVGGDGDDMLTGGSGSDTFFYNGGHDTITDYSLSDGDVLDLSDVITMESGSDLQATLEQHFGEVNSDGANTTITVQDIGTITLMGIDADDVSSLLTQVDIQVDEGDA